MSVCLLNLLEETIYPAHSAPILAIVAPPPGGNTVPTTTSSISDGFIPDCLSTPYRGCMSVIAD